jgi:riboflavin kinase/FMN adenylyltransferase
LTRLREKIQTLARHAVDRVLCVRFDAQFAELSAEAFIHLF